MKDYKLPEHIGSRAQLLALADEAKAAAESQQTSRIRTKYTSIQAGQGADMGPDLAEFMRLNNISPQDIKTTHTALDEIATHAPQVVCTLPANPSATQREQIIQWFRGEVHPLVLVNIHVDRTTLGGAVVRGRSRSWDFSVRRMFSGKKELIAEVVNNVG